MVGSTPSKMDQRKQNPKMKLEKNAGQIMGTNNSSIVSKRSVERLYHQKPHFFQHFVRKPQRRSPTINRGYWLRMQAIDSVVKEFLQRPTEKKKVVINLGCGYDPLPFQWLAREPDLCRNTLFVDVDYRELMLTKASIISGTPDLSRLIKPVEVSGPNFVVISEQYCGIGCDLRDAQMLDKELRSLGEFDEGLRDLDKVLILCIAEVSVTYMDPNGAHALISWARTLSDDVTFGLLEQFLPDGPDHPFAKTMLRHFEKLHTPLRSIHRYPDPQSHTQRFYDAGWKVVRFVNLWELWSDPEFLAHSQRIGLDQVEPFDEWEEFALFAAHYFLLTARTKTNSGKMLESAANDAIPDTLTKTTSHLNAAIRSYGLRYVENPKSRGLRRHGAVMRLSEELGDAPAAIAHHGGTTLEGRTSASDVYSHFKSGIDASQVPPMRIRARQCHTITRLNNGCSIMVGGRNSPEAGMQDCYIQGKTGWESVQDLPFPRYRHSAAPVVLANSEPGLLVFGGKNASDRLQHDIILWDQATGWQFLQMFGGNPQPRFGATFVALGGDFGLLLGGMQADGVVLQDLWKWKLVFRDEHAIGINFILGSPQIDADARSYFGRFGASYCLFKDQLLLIGGIASSGCIPCSHEVMSIDIGTLSGNDEEELSLRATTIDLERDVNVPRPMLVGHATPDSAQTEIPIAGGGAVCFSFGTYWNSGLYVVYDSAEPTVSKWGLVSSGSTLGIKQKPSSTANGLHSRMSDKSNVERLTLGSEADFIKLVKQSQPKILEELDYGPCRTQWTKEYLLCKIGAEKPVVVHEAHSRSMNFQRKDFAYITKPFGIFLDEIHHGAHQYLRSISSSDPTKKAANLELDFPALAGDFRIPPELRPVTDGYHSSPLRITGDVAMWLHVDTMANVLFQIEGSKRLILYPPADMVKLDFPPGSTTSNLEIFQGGDPEHIISIPDTHPLEAVLQAGDILFIPPLWAHTTAPLQRISIAVNIFFRSLPNGYAAGKDVYGNRDLEAYENGRRDVEKVARAFDNIPPDLAHAYLLRLADELRMKAERFAPD